MRLLVPLSLLFFIVGCATMSDQASSKISSRSAASESQGGSRAPKEIRLFESKALQEEKIGRRPVSLLRVRESADGTRQVFERCEIAVEAFAQNRERASATECKPIGKAEGYVPDQVSTFAAQSAGVALGPDWQALKISLTSLGVAASGTVAFFILDPTKLLASAMAGIAVISGTNVVVEAKRRNVLDSQTATLLNWNATSPELSIVIVNGSLFDSERVLRIALRRIDNGQEALKPVAPAPREEAVELIPLQP